MDLHFPNLSFPLDMGHLYCWLALLKIRQDLVGSLGMSSEDSV